MSIGDVLSIENKEIKEKFTQPPKHFTENTLLKAMEIAGNDGLDKNVEVERKGLGNDELSGGPGRHLGQMGDDHHRSS